MVDAILKAVFGYGTIGSMILSYAMYKDVFWMFVHGMFGWFYVIYYLIKF